LIPEKAESLLDDIREGTYQVRDLTNVEEYTASDNDRQFRLLRNAIFSDTTSCLNILDNFDLLFSYLIYADKLQATVLDRVEDILVAGLNTLLDNLETLAHSDSRTTKTALKMFVFLLASIEAARDIVGIKPVRVICKLAVCDITSVWKASPFEENFFKLLQDFVLCKTEKDGKESLPNLLQWLFDKCSKDSWIGWRSRVTSMLFTRTDKHLETLTDIICAVPNLACDLVVDIVKEVQTTENLQNESEGAKNVGAFIEKFARQKPREIQTHVSSLTSLLDCENYSIRNSVVASLGSLLEYLIKADQSDSAESETTASYREQLLTLLESRSLDRIVHCRTKVLEVFANLAENNLLPRHRFLPALQMAKDRLCDTGAFVRKKAGMLIEKLVIHNKFSVREFESMEEIQSQLNIVIEKKEKIKQALDGSHAEGEEEDPENLKTNLRNEEVLEGFLREYIDMLQMLTDCCHVMHQMLDSKQPTDVITAVEGLTVMQIANLPAAADALKRMLPLIWSKDTGVRSRISSAFSSKFLNLTAYTEDICLRKLFELIETLSVGEISSLEDLFLELLKSNLVPVRLLKQCWKCFKEDPHLSAVILLRFVSRTETNFLQQKYKKLLSRLLTLNCWTVYAEGLMVVLNLGWQGSVTDEFLNKSITKLMNNSGPGWHCAVQQLIKAVEELSPNSFVHLRNITVKALSPLYEAKVSEEAASQGIFVAGEVALRVLRYGDKLKIRYKEKFAEDSKTDDLEEISGGKAAQLEIQMQYLSEIQDKAILSETNLLGITVPAVESLARSLPQLKSLKLQQATLLTLAKFMCVSQSLCVRNIIVIISVLQGSLSASIKCNAVIAFGDLTLRYPNLMEEHSEVLFSSLRDREVEVRKKAMLVVTHLVLNDMLKMRGQMADVMLTLLDSSVKETAKTFFSELHLKDKKIIQNLLPDSLSKLLNMAGLTHGDFCIMVEYVFKYIDKSGVVTSMVEKLCQRLVEANSAQAENLAFCLSQLCYDDKSFRRLLDFASLWQRFVFEKKTTHTYFRQISEKSKKSLKLLSEELEGKLSGEEESRKRK